MRRTTWISSFSSAPFHRLVVPALFLGTLVPVATLASGCASEPSESRHVHSPAPAASANILPLRSLRLYETGVGYFERSGNVGSQTTALPVPAGHLDDALTSLVVLNGGAGGHVTGVAFTSSVTRATARTRAGLPQEPDSPIAFRDLLTSMKGERVTITKRDSDRWNAGALRSERNDEANEIGS